MMGHSHAVSGALLWLAVAPITSVAIGQPLPLPQIAAGTIACAGAALLPDLDHPSALAARTFGPLTQLMAKGISMLAGGHRQGTHTIAFCVGVAAAVWVTTLWAPPLATTIIMWLLVGLGFKGLHLSSRGQGFGAFITNGVVAASIVWAINTWMPQSYTWLWLAVLIGSIAHLLGDALTPEGVPFFAPLTQTRFALPIIPHTSHWLEVAFLTPLMAAGALLLAWVNYGQTNLDLLPKSIPFL